MKRDIRKNLILTFDYELFGDGSGDIFKHIIEPTNLILRILEKYNIKCTIFFEVVEYWSIKKEWKKGNKMGYKINPIKAINNQLQTAFKNGHDIQLHYHPQWLGAKYSSGKWKVNFENWRLADYNPVETLGPSHLLKEGKKTLKSILAKIDPTYKPTIIRAGGYNIMPSNVIGAAMIEEELIIDCSIYPGGLEKGSLSKYDYTKVSIDLDYWNAYSEDFTIPISHKTGIVEIPIFALDLPRWKKITWQRLKSALINKESSKNNLARKTENKTFLEKIKYWRENEALTWDFCLFNQKLHKYFINYIYSNLDEKRSYFVIIGHPKNFTSPISLTNFVELAKSKNFEFITLKDYAKRFDC